MPKSENNKAVGNRLRQLRIEKNMLAKDVAKIVGVLPSTYSRWEKGSNSPHKYIEKLSQIFNVSTDFILKGEESEADKQRNIIKVPVLGRVAAGIPIEAIQEVEDWEEMYKPGIGDDTYFALRIKGASMEPRLREGDIVIVKKTDYFDSGDVCIVLVNGNEATVKVVQKQADGLTLIGYNTSVYPPHFYSAKDVETLPVRIIGVVIEFRCKP